MKPLGRFRRRRVSGDHSENLGKLILGALGVVYGDIGTSPLYAIKECFNGPHAVSLDAANILGILSLVFWSVTLVVVVKYLFVIMRADNKGEGGIMALMALLMQKSAPGERPYSVTKIMLFGLFGAALLYGDGVITPAISVLSAVEGLEVAAPVLHSYVVPLTVLILIVLFLAQSRGTAKMGSIFGPVTLVWFVSIAAVAVPWILKRPEVLAALNPVHAIAFFFHNGLHGALVLGAVVLCITGGEALYADMGHFGKKPIRMAWFMVVFPALIINYFGQGALLLEMGGEAVKNPFYALVPKTLLYPMIGLATCATVIASQALISGAFSLTHQATQLGYLPRLAVVHTSERTEGQIYVPRVNLFLMIGCIALVLMFRESSGLAAAYGIAVTGTMAITSLLFYAVARQIWQWNIWPATLLTSFFLVIDLTFFGANTAKLFHGGWVPIVIATSIFLLMTTWWHGRAVLQEQMISRAKPLDEFVAEIEATNPPRVPGTAVFMTPNLDVAPGVLLHHYKHNKVLHEKIVLLTVVTKKVPFVKFDEHGRLTDLGAGIAKIVAKYGFMEQPQVMDILEAGGVSSRLGSDFSFYLGRETVLTTGTSRLARWRKKLFAFMIRNAQPATVFYRVPPDHVVELGSQVQI